MPTQWQTHPVKLEGGLTTNLGRIEQGINAPGSATVLQNFEPDIKGGYTRILGYEKYSTTAVPGSGQIYGVIALSDTEALVARGTQYQYSTGTTWTAKLSLTNPAITYIRSDTYNFAGTRKTVIVDGVNPPAYFDHTTKGMVYLSGHPADVNGAERVAVFKNHLFFAKGRNLSFTAPYLEDNFSAGSGGGIINIGDDITGIVVFREQLIVFCLNSIHRISGNTLDDFVLSPIAMNTGCLSGDTVQEVGGDIMYLGPDGIRYLSATERHNDFGLVRASEKIQTKVLSIVSTTTIYSSVTIAQKNQYRLFYYDAGASVESGRGFLATKYSNQTVEDIAWAELVGFKVYATSKYQKANGEVILFVSSTGYVYKMESGNSFDGADIEAIFETPYMPITDPKVRKTFYKHTLFATVGDSFTVTCAFKFDYRQTGSSPIVSFPITTLGSPTRYGSAVFGSSFFSASTEEGFYANVVGSAFTVAIQYRSLSQDPPFNLNFIALEYRANERR